MRRSIAKIPYRASTTSSIAAAFSTSSSGGGGRGRGGERPFLFTADTPTENEPKNEGAPPPPHGHGRGRGKTIPSSPILPSFSSFVDSDTKSPPLGRGRGFVPPNSTLPRPPPPQPSPNAEMPIHFVNDEAKQYDSAESQVHPVQEKVLPESIMNILSGSGRGKPIKSPGPQSGKPTVENRHLRQQQAPVYDAAAAGKSSTGDQLSKDQKVKRARDILSKGGQQVGGRGIAAAGGRGASGGRDRGRGRGRGRGIGDQRYEEVEDELDEDEDVELDPAEEEELVQTLGPEFVSCMDEVVYREAFRDELKNPNSYASALDKAYDMNLRIECEPEYLMEEFGTNPDIDEKPPISLEEALEKVKPFLVACEGIQSQEEWERIIKETTKKVPIMKEIVDYYSGPDRVTAKQQQEELERVAKILPARAPDSVKRFTDRAILSLQSNPGWRFDKKCNFMDTLVREVSKQYS